ncbi:hypothetical protein FGB62_457g016 [Gracilaria domingensis]|nr:hypothetical protein FGB62_457g016 [Gracilaria domingensis]
MSRGARRGVHGDVGRYGDVAKGSAAMAWGGARREEKGTDSKGAAARERRGKRAVSFGGGGEEAVGGRWAQGCARAVEREHGPFLEERRFRWVPRLSRYGGLWRVWRGRARRSRGGSLWQRHWVAARLPTAVQLMGRDIIQWRVTGGAARLAARVRRRASRGARSTRRAASRRRGDCAVCHGECTV